MNETLLWPNLKCNYFLLGNPLLLVNTQISHVIITAILAQLRILRADVKSSKVNNYVTAGKKYKGLVTREIKIARNFCGRSEILLKSSIFYDEIPQIVALSG